MYIPEIWDDIIRKARKYPSPFDLKVSHDDFFDMKNEFKSSFLKTPKPPLKLQQVRMMMVS